MLNSFHLLTRHLINIVVFLSSLAIAGNLFTDDFILTIAFFASFGVYFISNKVVTYFQKRKLSKQFQLTMSEFNQIERALKTARDQTNSLTQQYIRVRSQHSFKLLQEMSKVARRIINIVQTNPTRFYAVEDFFYAHLPSSVQLANNYALLTKEKVQGTEIHLALEDTRQTLKGLHETMEQDLKLALQSDIENLKIELDFAKLANEKRNDQQ